MMHLRVSYFIALFLFFAAALLPCIAESNSTTRAGESLYRSRCSLCHGTDGRAKTTLGQQLKAADLHSAQVQDNSDSLLRQVILHGKGNMPPFEGQLNDVQVRELLQYVREFGKKRKR
jgi:mono/diheme cytochrome c family protein